MITLIHKSEKCGRSQNEKRMKKDYQEQSWDKMCDCDSMMQHVHVRRQGTNVYQRIEKNHIHQMKQTDFCMSKL